MWMVMSLADLSEMLLLLWLNLWGAAIDPGSSCLCYWPVIHLVCRAVIICLICLQCAHLPAPL